MKILLSAIVAMFVSTPVMAIDFLQEFNGKTVTCEIGSFNEDNIPDYFKTDFELLELKIVFDSQSEIARMGFNLPPEQDLYIIEFQIKSQQGVFSKFFTMDKTELEFSKKKKKHIMRYEDTRKSFHLEFAENLIRDKYKFIKNGEVQFSCRSLFDYN
jgi:hypothetical protein